MGTVVVRPATPESMTEKYQSGWPSFHSASGQVGPVLLVERQSGALLTESVFYRKGIWEDSQTLLSPTQSLLGLVAP
jgi:hypothetical protein